MIDKNVRKMKEVSALIDYNKKQFERLKQLNPDQNLYDK